MEIICRKVSYGLQKFADYDIERLKKSTRSVVPIRSYLCTKCNTYHLTSSNLDRNIFIQELIKSNLLMQDKLEKVTRDLSELKSDLRNNYTKILGKNTKDITIKKLKEQCLKKKNRFIEIQKKFHKQSQEYSRFKTEVIKILKYEP